MLDTEKDMNTLIESLYQKIHSDGPVNSTFVQAQKYYYEQSKGKRYTVNHMLDFLDDEEKESMESVLDDLSRDGKFPDSFNMLVKILKSTIVDNAEKLITILPITLHVAEIYFLCITTKNAYPIRILKEDDSYLLVVLSADHIPTVEDSLIWGHRSYYVVAAKSSYHLKYLGTELHYVRYDEDYHRKITSEATLVYVGDEVLCEMSDETKVKNIRIVCVCKPLIVNQTIRTEFESLILMNPFFDSRTLGNHIIRFFQKNNIPETSLSFMAMVIDPNLENDVFNCVYNYEKGELSGLSYVENDAFWYFDLTGDWEYQSDTMEILGSSENIDVYMHLDESKELFYNMYSAQITATDIIKKAKEQIKHYFPKVQIAENIDIKQ